MHIVKAADENMVLNVSRRIIAALRNRQFFSIYEINQSINEELVKLVNRPFQKLEGNRLSAFEKIDKPALQPLPTTKYEFFCTENGNYIEPRNYMRSFYRVCSNAGIPRTNVHSMRHTFATRLFESNESAKTVQELLGHSDITQTLNTYTHVMPEVKKSAVQKLNKMFKGFDM